jgi:hypothetical protein
MDRPTDEDFLDAVQTFADFFGATGFPKSDTARTLVWRYLAKFVESKEALNWLLEAAVTQIADWRDAGGMPKLRAIYSQKYRPLDQVDEPEYKAPAPEEWKREEGLDKHGLPPPLPVPPGAFSFDPPGKYTPREAWMLTLPNWARKGYDPKTGLVKGSEADQERLRQEVDKKRAAMMDILRAQLEQEAKQKAQENEDDEDDEDDKDPIQ